MRWDLSPEQEISLHVSHEEVVAYEGSIRATLSRTSDRLYHTMVGVEREESEVLLAEFEQLLSDLADEERPPRG